MSRVSDFLAQNKMLAESFDRQQLIDTFIDDMHTHKTLCMNRTFLNVVESELTKEKILAIDAGGTNLRFALFENGTKISEEKMPMFGFDKQLSADEFFDLMAEQISKYDCEKIGFCFSYPFTSLENKDGKILWFDKEIKICGAENKVVGEEINKRLTKKRRFFLLNDSVASQLGVSADIGIILGTGFNICFTSKNDGMIINSECGQYRQLPEGVFDKKLNEELANSISCAEKLISGAYLGKLIEITASEYFCRKLPDFELVNVSEFLIGEGPLYSYFDDNEKRDFREIIDCILERAADIVAIFIKCIISYNEIKPGSKVRIALEGSTIYKTPGYSEKVKNAITNAVDADIEFIDARNTILLGAVRACM